MITPTPSTNPFQGVIAAELAIALGPINNFLTALQKPDVNIQAATQDFANLQLAEIQSAPLAESVGIQQLAALAQGKLQALVASVAAAAPAPVAPVVAAPAAPVAAPKSA